jgi:hypothetical protein
MVLPYRRTGAPCGMESAGSICQAEATAAAVALDWDSAVDEDLKAFLHLATPRCIQGILTLSRLSRHVDAVALEVLGRLRHIPALHELHYALVTQLLLAHIRGSLSFSPQLGGQRTCG